MNLGKTIWAIALFCNTALTVFGVNYWINPGQGKFSDAANWSSNSVPSGSDDARVNNGGIADLDFGTTVSMQLLQIADTNTTTGTVRMTGGSLTLSSDLRAGGSSATNPGTNGGVGLFQLEGGTVVMTGNLNAGFGTNNPSGIYNIYGGSIQCNGSAPIFAVGNRGTGLVNQTNGTIYMRFTNGLTQLGRNVANATGFGTYNLSGGTLATSRLQFGNANGNAAISTNTFNLSATGTLICNSISNINTAAVNTFNFTGGTLTVTTSRISITNNGGVFSPSTPDFLSAAGTNLASLPINPIGTATFIAGNTYIQGSNGTLAIDIASDTSFDSINITTNIIPGSMNSSIDGTIAVNFLNGYVPATNTTYDILTADTVTCTATVTANYGAILLPSVVTFLGTDGLSHQKLRLTVTTQPVVVPQLNMIYSPGYNGGALFVAFTNTPSHIFSVLGSPTVDGSFTKVGTTTETPAGQYYFLDTNVPASSQKFYRVRFP